MMFLIKYSKIKISNGVINYLVDEYSFNAIPVAKSLPAILIQNIYLTFDYVNKTANDIWGYHPYQKWITSQLLPPICCTGELILLRSMNRREMYRIPTTEQWQTHYDKSSGWICIGNTNYYVFENNYDDYNGAVEFYPNVIATLRNGELESLWIKPHMIGEL